MLAVGALSAAAPLSHAATPAPEGRGYERISPAEKGIGSVYAVVGAADAGDDVTFTLNGAIGDPNSFGVLTTFHAQRTPAQWENTEIAPALSVIPDPGSEKSATVVAVSDDGQSVLVQSQLPLESRDHDGAGWDLYRLDVATGAATLISAGSSGEDTNSAFAVLAGASADLSRIVFSTDATLLPGDAVVSGVYEWADGELTLLSRMSDGRPMSGQADESASGSMRSGFDGSPNFLVPSVPHGGAHVVSEDGSVVFWQEFISGAARRLFARVNGTDTIAYSTSQRTLAGGVPAGTQPTNGRFIAAAPDGSAVYFASISQLSDDATTGGGIYRYTFADERLSQVTSGSQGGANVGISSAIASADGSHVYFTTNAALTPEATPLRLNGYVWSADGGTQFVAEFTSGAPRVEGVNRDGRFALISSTASLAGAQTGGTRQFYWYDAATSELRCASCRASGDVSGASPALISTGSWFRRNITDDGEVYFQTPDPLVDGDINGKDDVYGFDGELPFLISSGRGYGGEYGDTSDDGSNVYFVTYDGLVDDDVDGLGDVYSARRGGGFPSQQETPPVRCVGIACAPEAPPAPDLQIPLSEVLDGAGNVVEEPPRPSVRPALLVGRVSAAAKKRFARSGHLRLLVRTTTAAKVTAIVSVRVGRRWVRTDGARRSFPSAGRASLRVSLSRGAQRVLAERGSLRVRMQVRSSRTTGTSTQSFVLRSKDPSRDGGR